MSSSLQEANTLKKILTMREKMKLGFLATGLQSIRRGMEWEHSQVENDPANYGSSSGAADMGDMYLGDVTISNKPSVKSQLGKLVTAAALLAGGFAGGTLVSKLVSPPVVEPVDFDTGIVDIGIIKGE